MIRSVSSIAAVYAMVIVGPDTRYGALACYDWIGPPVVVGQFRDVDACKADGTRLYRTAMHCECVYGGQSRIATYYYRLAVPVSFIAMALLVTYGTRRQQLLQLNAAVIGGGALLVGYYVYDGHLYDLGVPMSLALVGVLAVATSLGLVVLRFVGRSIWRPVDAA